VKVSTTVISFVLTPITCPLVSLVTAVTAVNDKDSPAA